MAMTDGVDLDLEEHTPSNGAEAREIYAERLAEIEADDAEIGLAIWQESNLALLALLAARMSLRDGEPRAAADMYIQARDHIFTVLNRLGDAFEEVPSGP